MSTKQLSPKVATVRDWALVHLLSGGRLESELRHRHTYCVLPTNAANNSGLWSDKRLFYFVRIPEEPIGWSVRSFRKFYHLVERVRNKKHHNCSVFWTGTTCTYRTTLYIAWLGNRCGGGLSLRVLSSTVPVPIDYFQWTNGSIIIAYTMYTLLDWFDWLLEVDLVLRTHVIRLMLNQTGVSFNKQFVNPNRCN